MEKFVSSGQDAGALSQNSVLRVFKHAANCLIHYPGNSAVSMATLSSWGRAALLGIVIGMKEGMSAYV